MDCLFAWCGKGFVSSLCACGKWACIATCWRNQQIDCAQEPAAQWSLYFMPLSIAFIVAFILNCLLSAVGPLLGNAVCKLPQFTTCWKNDRAPSLPRGYAFFVTSATRLHQNRIADLPHAHWVLIFWFWQIGEWIWRCCLSDTTGLVVWV